MGAGMRIGKPEMSGATVDGDATTAALRRFGLQTAAATMLMLGCVIPWLRQVPVMPRWPFAVGLVLALWALMHPASLAPLQRLLHGFGQWVARINTVVLLTVFFMCVMTPVAFVLRLLGKDPLRRAWLPDAPSYRIPSRQQKPHHLEVPF